ncbi:unnamed protein product [Darwinula stevensoni]|uniref:rRNA methyltransferase 2, mitochondrial n=1 Tax=Darwinula stevensoni TaxID=69355 RepID=A0A7R9A267_9CRUS|nr:unnamed protein product [Darwinula stevensoni]CAG0889105.1 unnamed protein product [Darwinula stevensoni]
MHRLTAAGVFRSLFRVVKTNHSHSFCRMKVTTSAEWVKRQLRDPYVQMRRAAQYRARSAYKLIEIDDKYKLFKKGQCVVDCGAAPGAWTQVAVQRTQVDTSQGEGEVCVVAVDLLPIQPVKGAITIAPADFTHPSTITRIQDALSNRAVSVVLSDMSPTLSGIKELDHENGMMLAIAARDFALTHSALGAHFLCKIFQGGTENKFLESLKEFYEHVRYVKPNSSRSESREIYVLARRMKKRI